MRWSHSLQLRVPSISGFAPCRPNPRITVAAGFILISRLYENHKFPIDNLRRSAHFSSIVEWRTTMLDLVFLALGLGGFALMAAYAVLCDRL